MDLTKLKYFSVVVDTGSVRRAAELLRVSPAAVSKAIRGLEDSAGKKLVMASGRGIAITEAGLALRERSRRLLLDYDAFLGELKRPNEGPQALRIGTFEIFSTYFLGWALSQYFPDRQVLVREVGPAEIESALLQREVDIGITYIPVPHEELDFLKVATQEMAIFGKKEAFGKMPFEKIPFCVPTTSVSGSALNVQALDGWPATGPGRNIRYQFQMLETALNAAGRSMGAVFCPTFVVRLYNQLVKPAFQLDTLPSPKALRPVRMNIFLVKRRSDLENRDIKVLAKALRLACR